MVRGKQTASWLCAEGSSSLSQHPDAEMTEINHSAQNGNCSERACTAGTRGDLLGKRCDLSGGEWQSGRQVRQQTSLLPVMRSPPNASGSTLALRAPLCCSCCKAWADVSPGGFKVLLKPQQQPKMGEF